MKCSIVLISYGSSMFAKEMIYKENVIKFDVFRAPKCTKNVITLLLFLRKTTYFLTFIPKLKIHGRVNERIYQVVEKKRIKYNLI